MKYHITKNGLPAICTATSRPCPLGGDDVHFNTQAEAEKYIEAKYSKEYGLVKQPNDIKYKDSIEDLNAALSNYNGEVYVEVDSEYDDSESDRMLIEDDGDDIRLELEIGGLMSAKLKLKMNKGDFIDRISKDNSLPSRENTREEIKRLLPNGGLSSRQSEYRSFVNQLREEKDKIAVELMKKEFPKLATSLMPSFVSKEEREVIESVINNYPIEAGRELPLDDYALADRATRLYSGLHKSHPDIFTEERSFAIYKHATANSKYEDGSRRLSMSNLRFKFSKAVQEKIDNGEFNL